MQNISDTREFVWNLATRPLAEQMNASCAPVGPEVDEFTLAGVTAAPSRIVSVPRVLESPVNFECRLTQLVPLQNLQGQEVGSWMVFAEVVAVHIERRLL